MQLNKLPGAHKEKFCANGVNDRHFVTSEGQGDTADFHPLGIKVNRQYRLEHAAQDELVDLLCSLLTDTFFEAGTPPESATTPTCLKARDE